MKKSKGIGSKVIIALTMLFFYLPIIYIIIFSFNDSRSLTTFSGFSLRWYEKMFADSTMMEAVLYTVVIAIIATVVSTIVGTITAIGLSKCRKVLQASVEHVNNLPVLNPEIVTAIGLLMFFSALAIKKGFMTMLLAHIMFCVPYVMLSVSPKLRSLDPNLIDAAMDLGATPFQALYKVIVPQIKPGIVSGALIAFTMSFDDFIISYFVTGNGVQNISILVYTMSKRINPSINALSTLVILMITAALLIGNIVPALRDRAKRKRLEAEGSGAKVRNPLPKWTYAAVAGALVIAIVAFAALQGAAKAQKTAEAIEKYGSATLKFYNCGEYIGEHVISDFEAQYGVDVICEYYDSNEMLYTKLQAGDSYDVIVPSDYLIQRLIENDALTELDHSLIPNLANLADDVKHFEYDPANTYSVPYFWGSVGLVYNTQNVPTELIEEQGYSILKNTDYKGRIYVYDSERDAFMLAFKALGYSMNTENEDEIMAAYDWLTELNNTMDPVYVTDEVIDAMMGGLKDIAVVYSGDAAVILDENEDMSFFAPLEGTNIWCDAMVIPKNAENPLLAHEFINYIISYDVAYDNTEYVGYASPVEEVLAEMTAEGGAYAENEAYYPRSGYELDEVFRDNRTLMQKLSQLWIKVKAQ
ncbi:MAG: extracellular solute-binding protein [Oscillospiraceae bacterium]|nr:extracellular solute-binding protein [Oscillospiraceae bacterium]